MGWGLVIVTNDGKRWCWLVSSWVDCWLARARVYEGIGKRNSKWGEVWVCCGNGVLSWSRWWCYGCCWWCGVVLSGESCESFIEHACEVGKPWIHDESWLSSRVLKVCVVAPITTCIFCYFVWISSSRRWFVEWIASSKSQGVVGLVSLGGIGKGNESTNDDKFGNYLSIKLY